MPSQLLVFSKSSKGEIKRLDSLSQRLTSTKDLLPTFQALFGSWREERSFCKLFQIHSEPGGRRLIVQKKLFSSWSKWKQEISPSNFSLSSFHRKRSRKTHWRDSQYESLASGWQTICQGGVSEKMKKNSEVLLRELWLFHSCHFDCISHEHSQASAKRL